MNSKYLALDIFLKSLQFFFFSLSDLYPFILAHVLYKPLKSNVHNTTPHW